MKLIRFGTPGEEKPGLQLEDGSRLDATGFGMDWDSEFFSDPTNLENLKTWLGDNEVSAPKISPDTRLGPAVCRGRGGEERKHAAVTNNGMHHEATGLLTWPRFLHQLQALPHH